MLIERLAAGFEVAGERRHRGETKEIEQRHLAPDLPAQSTVYADEQ